MFNYGMKPVVYSARQAQEEEVGWHRAGANVSYLPNQLLKSSRRPKPMYTLRFSYTFQYAGDSVYFAYNYPYTYTQLTEYLDKLEWTHPEYSP